MIKGNTKVHGSWKHTSSSP